MFVDDIIVVKIMISLIKLIEGGAAILAARIKKSHIEKLGINVINPFVMYMLRVWVISYIIFAAANIAEDLNPWAIVIVNAPSIPQIEDVDIAANRSPICPTEEYAIIDFMSGCRIQINLVSVAPIIDTEINSGASLLVIIGSIKVRRIIP